MKLNCTRNDVKPAYPAYLMRGLVFGTTVTAALVLGGCGKKEASESKEGGVTSLAPLLDTDKDGVPDSRDKCPKVKGLKTGDGCPAVKETPPVLGGKIRVPAPPAGGTPVAPPKESDRDGDGVPDARDRCPDKAGIKNNSGCPRPVLRGKVRMPHPPKTTGGGPLDLSK